MNPHKTSSQRRNKQPRLRSLRADLHIHTTASDSRWTPEQVVEGCRASGIGLLAVADHDTTDAVLTTEALALEAGLSFLRAVEVSTMSGTTLLHILGYGINPMDPVFRGMLAENRAKLEAVDDEDIEKLIAIGYDLNYEEYMAYDYDRTRGGFRSLNYCIDKGICRDALEFFSIIRAKLGHRWPDFIHPREAVHAIRNAGGIPVLAHPGASLKDCGGVSEATLSPLLNDGIAGLEAYSQYHDVATTACCVGWCEDHDLIITGGSDYHGGFVGRQLGIPVIDTTMLHLGSLEAHIRSV